VVRAFGDGADAAHDLELVALECLAADSDICDRRLKKLEDEWKNPKLRDKVERERAVVQRVADALSDGKGAHTVELRPAEEVFVKGFQLLTRKSAVLLVNVEEGGTAPELDPGPMRVLHTFAACLSLEADLAALEGEDREMFAAEYGVTEPLKDRFVLASYRGMGLVSFFTVGEDEVKAWTIEEGDDAVTAAGKIHTDLARGFIRAEVTPYDALKAAGSMRDAKAAGKQHLEGKEYCPADGDILNIRFSV
jgi:ribosome-binding ATPase YchF (GTP1/OBG family)